MGQDLSEAVLDNIVTTRNGIDPTEAPLVFASFPKIIPKLVGVEIVEGCIFDPDVSDSVAAYDAGASAWLSAHQDCANNERCAEGLQIPPDLLPTLGSITAQKRH